MKPKKTETFIYEGLGFPIKLIDVPMKKVLGQWVMDIDMNKFQLFIFNSLIHKPTRLTGSEMKFMRKFLELSTTELGKKLGVSHAAILKWEKGGSQMNPTQEIYLRMLLLECLKNNELVKVFEEIKPEKLVELKRPQPLPPIDMKDMHFVA